MKNQVLKVLGALVVIAVVVLGGPGGYARAETVVQWMPSDLAYRIFKGAEKLEGEKWSKKKAKFEAGVRIPDDGATVRGNAKNWTVKISGELFLDFPYDVASGSVSLTQTLSYKEGFLTASSSIRTRRASTARRMRSCMVRGIAGRSFSMTTFR